LAFDRRCQGASEDIDALPPLEIRANPESAAASAFSLNHSPILGWQAIILRDQQGPAHDRFP
jgi:hypothetical protein